MAERKAKRTRLLKSVARVRLPDQGKIERWHIKDALSSKIRRLRRDGQLFPQHDVHRNMGNISFAHDAGFSYLEISTAMMFLDIWVRH